MTLPPGACARKIADGRVATKMLRAHRLSGNWPPRLERQYVRQIGQGPQVKVESCWRGGMKMAEKVRLCRCGCGRKLDKLNSDFLMPSHEKALKDSRKKRLVPPTRKAPRR